MAHYKLNFIHPAMGRVLFFEDLFADDDEAAMKAAEARATDRATELWRGDRKLATFAASEPDSNPDGKPGHRG
jgi:hypothetical protein